MPSRTRDDDALFVKDGTPVKFCFHQSVTQGRGQITRDVERHGGQIVADERRANVLLVDEEQDIELLRRRYYSSTELHRLLLYVEPRGFVRACLRDGEYRHLGPKQGRMPGRPPVARTPGRTRMAFTEEDREHLAYYLATLFPTRDGRMGNKAYKDLELLGQTDDPNWEWARRHTWSSWREHYKIHPDAMDVRIDRHLRTLKDIGHHLGRDPRSHDDKDVTPAQREEEEEEEEDAERQRQRRRQRQRAERQGGRERRQADSVASASRRSAETTRRKKGLHNSDGNLQDDEEDERPQRVKPRRVQSDAIRQDEPSSSRGRVSRVEPEEESEERQGQRMDREENQERVQGDRPTTATLQQPSNTAREDLVHREKLPVGNGGDEDIQDEEDEEQLQAVKRHRAQFDADRQHESPNSPAKRARIPEASSSQRHAADIEADSSSKGGEDSDAEISLEIEGSDLFGDHLYGSQPESDDKSNSDFFGDREYGSQPNCDDAQDFDVPMRFSSPTRPVNEQNGLPISTQETLVPSSPLVETESNLAPIPTQRDMVEASLTQVAVSSPPSSQRTLVTLQEHGTSVRREPSVPKEARRREVAAVSDAPYRNTRARSRSVEPLAHLDVDPQPARQRAQTGEGKKKGKEKAKEVLPLIEEDMDVEEEEYDEESVRQLPVSNSLSTQDEMSVEALLEDEMSQQDEEDEESDEDIMPDLPRFQEVEIEGEPSDSDDVETHEVLVRGGVRQKSTAGEGESESIQDQYGSEDDAARVEQMASGTLLSRNPAVQPSRITRSKAMSQELSPRRTRSGSHATRKVPQAFPSPGTKARAVVDRIQEDERRMPYVPPTGSRAAKAMKGKAKDR